MSSREYGIFLIAVVPLMVNIRIQAPPGSGSLYFNYKHWHSIILLAVVSADY